jgi:dTDP-4-dehydrorhamnose 3,5-epimerase
MTTEQTFIKDLVILTPKIFNDERIVFLKLQSGYIHENGIKHEFIQDNQSFSKKRVIRGLHSRLILMHKPSWFVF